MKEVLLRFIWVAALAIATLASVIALWKDPLILSSVLILIGMFFWSISKSKKDIALFLISGFAGAAVESISISFGIWSYTEPTVYNIPYWLPLLWGDAALFIKNMHIVLTEAALQIKKNQQAKKAR